MMSIHKYETCLITDAVEKLFFLFHDIYCIYRYSDLDIKNIRYLIGLNSNIIYLQLHCTTYIQEGIKNVMSIFHILFHLKSNQ